jgi:hypothetical protein
MVIGALYTLGTVYAATFMVLMQFAALPILWQLIKTQKNLPGQEQDW